MQETEITKARIAEVDALYSSPKERAERIWATFQAMQQELKFDFSFFDLACFAIQWMGMLSITFSEDEELRDIAKRANIWLHKYHYSKPEEIHGKPDKE